MSDTNVHRVVGNLLVGTSHFFVDTLSNQVGINTSNPTASLDIATGDLKVGSGITLASGGTITATNFSGNGSGLTQINSDSGSWVNGASSNIHLAVSTDKVGIGTVDPSHGLVIRKNTDTLLLESENAGTNHAVNIDFKNYDTQDPVGARVSAIDDTAYGSHLTFHTKVQDGNDVASAITERMRIQSNGRVGIGVTDPDSKLEVRGDIQASYSDTNHGMLLESAGTLRRNYGGYGAGFHFTNIAIWPTDYLGNYSAGGIDFGSSSYRWKVIWTGGLNASSTINLTTTASIRQDSTTWTGNPGTQGKLEYHDRKWYVVAGSNSQELALFRRDGADKVSITNDGNFLRRSYSNGYLIGGQNNIGATDAKTNPIYTIGTSHMPSDTGLGDMYGIGYSHGNFTSMLTSGWGMYVAADGDIRIGLNASNGIIKCTGYVDTPQIYMGSQVTQHINLYGTSYGIGVQSYTTYFRSDGNFIFYRGGSHNNNEGHGGGGQKIVDFNRNGYIYFYNAVQAHAQFSVYGTFMEQYNQRRTGSGSYPTRLAWPNNGHHIDCYHTSGAPYYVDSGHAFHINHYAQQTVYLNRSGYSDRRIKKNIKDINDTSALDTLRKLQPKTYEYKLNPEKGVVYGFIAQEVKEVLPHATNVTTLSAPFEAEDFINATFEKLEDEKVTVTLENPLNPKYPIQPGINLLFKVGPNETMDYKILEIVDDTHIIIDNDKHVLPAIQPILVGSQVNDFHGLDKDVIFTVATAALQEVDRQLQTTKADVATLQAVNHKLESRVTLLETALTSVYNDINRDWVRYEKVDPKPKNVSIPAEVSNYLVKLGWACALIKEGREVTFQSGRTAKVKEVLDQKNFTVDRSLVDGQDTLERVEVETIKKDDLLNVAVSTVREVSEAILDEGVLKKVDDRLAVLDARLAALENM